MISLSCSACAKKLSVKEDLAGKKVKCPGCGQVMVVPAAARAALGPPVSLPDASTIPPAPVDVSEVPTHPPVSNPDATLGVKPAGHDSSLTDFLAPPQADDELGRLGKYRILKVLGHGGMGVVYKAEDLKLKRTVALKAMLPTLAASASCGQRFLREAEAMAAVEHDHIVRIYQIDEERGIPFMAMEFLKGEPLDERLKRDAVLPLDEVLRIGREIAEGLAAAHATGLIHRDIKPGNVWLESRVGQAASLSSSTAAGGHGGTGKAACPTEYRVKILDFGLARAASQDSGLTQQGAIIGTPAYMAPEQGRGDNVDSRCDLFSLGVVLYRLCTGKQPFRGNDTVSTLMSVAMDEPVAPIDINAELPQELSDLVMKLLEKDPAKRIASASEVVLAIQALEKKLAASKLADERTEAGGVAPVRTVSVPLAKTGGQARRLPNGRSKARVALAAAFTVLALVAGAIVFYWQTNHGVVRIEINDPDIQFTMDKTGPTFKGADQHEIKVAPGVHGLTIKRGDLEFDTDKFILKKGETITLKIEWFDEGKVQVMQDGKIVGAKWVKVDGPAIAPPSPSNGLRFTAKNSVTVPTLFLNTKAVGSFYLKVTLEAYVTPSQENQDRYQSVVGFGDVLHLNAVGALNKMKLEPGWYFSQSTAKTAGRAGPAPMVPNRRVHLAGVYNSGTLSLFVDGKHIASRKRNIAYEADAPVLIGGGFDGVIEEVRISKAARYTGDFTPAKRFERDKNTLALYRFDEGAGDVLNDSSGNGHHGKIVGATWADAHAPALPKGTDLLSLIDPQKDALLGNWTFQGSTLPTEQAGSAARSHSR